MRAQKSAKSGFRGYEESPVFTESNPLLPWLVKRLRFGASRAHHFFLRLAWLNRRPAPGWGTCPPRDLPLNRLSPSPQAADARRVVEFIARQTNGADALCAWCLHREQAYWMAYRWSDALCCYAAARDAAGWQLNCDEAALCLALEAFAHAAKKSP